MASDTEIALRVPPINKTTCYASTDIPAVDIQHRNDVGIYGPNDAHDHEDWVGDEGAETPDSLGQFSVSSTGTPALQLNIASNYDDRLDEVPDQNFPSGVPGAPQIYWYRKADIWRSYDGATCPDESTWSSPKEGVYCWLGWAFVKFRFPTIPQACTLNVKLRARTYTYSDNHLSDSSRQTEFSYSKSDTDYTYSLDVKPDQQDYELCLVTPSQNVHPRFERTIFVQVSNFADGDWQLDEPQLTLDSDDDMTTGHSFIKSFESVKSQYKVGGVSAHVDAAYEALYCGDDNHQNHVEDTIPNFDYREGAKTGYDLTTAFSLSQLCNIMQNATDAWNISRDDDAWDTATLDNEDNRLTGGYSFDLCYPETEFDDEMGMQPVDDGTGNAALRCGTWNIVRGVKCRVLPDKFCGGRTHGTGIDRTDDDRLARSQDNIVQVWYRPDSDSEWTQYGSTIGTDDKGHWCSRNLEELNPDTLARWFYGISKADAETASEDIGKAYTREFIVSVIIVGIPDLVTELDYFGNIYRAWPEGKDVKMKMSGWLSSSIPEVLVNTAQDAVDAIWMIATSAILMVGASLGDGTEECWLSKAPSQGEFYTPGAMPMTINHGLTKYTVRPFSGLRYYVGYESSSGNIVCRRYMPRSDTLVTFSNDDESRTIASASEEVRPGFVTASDGSLLVDVPTGTGEATRYRSTDGGETWTEVPG